VNLAGIRDPEFSIRNPTSSRLVHNARAG
jgi:hypothetical protein